MSDTDAPLVQKINPPGLLAPPGGLHAHVVMTPPTGRLAFLAGNVAIDQAGAVIGGDSYYEQAVQTFRNIKLAIEAVGRLENVVQMTIFVVRFEDALLEEINRASRFVFGKDWPVTATTLVGVQALSASSFLIEVNAIVSVVAA